MKQAYSIVALTALAAVMIFGFQNCSNPIPVDSDKVAAEAAAKVEFAYDATIDQITYMSCAVAEPGTFDAGAYFSFRFGSYRNAGLRLNEAFRTANGKKPVDKQAELLSESPANTLTSVQVAIRDRKNFQTMYTSTGTAVRGQDYVNVLEPLGTLDLSDLLVKLDPAQRIKYLRNGTVFGARMEGSLYFTKNPTLAGSIRRNLINDATFALTYSHTPSGATNDTMARSPASVYEGSTANPNTQVYGRGFNMNFGQPVVGASPSNANFPNVILRDVTEMNLLNTTDRAGLATWTCPDTLRFRIVRPEDVKANLATCGMAPDPAVLTQDLAIIRNQLRVEDWYVDMINKCIVPKKAPATCYGSAVKVVQYDISQTCQEGVDAACVSFASVCYRQ
jgi:hypothetical protein